MRYARTSPDGRSEFATSRLSLLRAQIGLASKDPSVTVTPDDLATLATAAKAAKTPDDPILLGFYYYSHKDPAQAIEWFKTALDRKGGAKAARATSCRCGPPATISPPSPPPMNGGRRGPPTWPSICRWSAA